MQTHMVIGAGQVGTAIFEVLGTNPNNEVHMRDLGPGTGVVPADVVHICFPFDQAFAGYVQLYKNQHKAGLVIIHSTVPIGTCARLGAVHSPVSGRHPTLADDIKAFTKWFGGPRAAEAAMIFTQCAVPVLETPRAETTELGKLMQTLQYGYQIVLEREAHRLSEEFGADFKVAYMYFNHDYNKGNEDLRRPFRFSLIDHVDGPIGGHCIIPNAELLAPVSFVADELLMLNRRLANAERDRIRREQQSK